jgi:hypothetical protein
MQNIAGEEKLVVTRRRACECRQARAAALLGLRVVVVEVEVVSR